MNDLTKLQKQNAVNSLQTLVRSGIMNIEGVLGKDNMTKRAQIERLHPYSLTPPSKEGGYWQTRVKDNGKMRNIKATTREDLLDKLVKIYATNSHLDNITFHDLYLEWLGYKQGVTSSPNTIKRHKQHYTKYFEPSALHNAKLSALDELFLESACNHIIKEHNMTRKEWNNIKGILKGMFEYAKRKKYLADNPLDNIRINVKFRQVSAKKSSDVAFTVQEEKAYKEFLLEQYQQTADTSYLALYMNFFLGLRVGELVALKWGDIWGNELHVCREEIRDQTVTPTPYIVVEHTKTHTDRTVVLPKAAQNILSCIPRSGEYIFMRKGERTTTKRISTINRQYARTSGKLMSSHTIRRTYASRLHSQGVPYKVIQEQLGHADMMTTMNYIYNLDTPDNLQSLINGVFQD